MSENLKRSIIDYLYIIFGTTILAIGLNSFLDPHGLVIGGATGLAIIIRSLSIRFFQIDVPLSVTNIILNIPLLIICFKVFGWKYLKRTLFATVYLSVALIYTKWIPVIESDLTLASIFGGVLAGAGLGFTFKCSATTGGTDLVASIIHNYNKHISLSKIMFVIDVIIIAAGFFVFGSLATLYAVIAVFIITKIIDTILEGFSFAKAAFIISDKYDLISEEITKNLERGATAIYGKGLYTLKEKNIILCVVSSKEIIKLKELTAKADPNAFVIVADVREVLGEGFKPINTN